MFTLRKMGSQCEVSSTVLSLMYLDSGYIMNVESTEVEKDAKLPVLPMETIDTLVNNIHSK